MVFTRFVSHGLAVSAVGAVLSVFSAGSALAQQCPDWQLNGIPVSTDAETAWTAQQYPMYAGGGLDLSLCTSVPNGRGFITAAPSFSISYDARSMGRALEFRVESQCDTTLLINDATATWQFSDDDGGTLNPRLRLAGAPSGRYDVWVGTYGNSACQAPLVVESFPPQAAVAATCPEWSLGGAEVRLNASQSETRPVTAGGQVSLFDNACGIQGHGFVAQAPDFSVMFDPQGQNATLEVSVQGQCDTLMLINDAQATWLFNDDTNDLNPMLSLPNAVAGRYDVWIGTFGSQLCPANVTFSSYGPQAVPPTTPAAPSK